MNDKNFQDWLAQFKPSIASYDYYVDFDKVISNAFEYKAELHVLNSLLGSKAIEEEFISLVEKYPDVLKVVPILIAVRTKEIKIYEVGELVNYQFNKGLETMRAQEYADFMRACGLFGIMENHTITNLQDYVLGIEVGLDSNGRKNRGGHLMEDRVESYLTLAGLEKIPKEQIRTIDGSKIFYKELNASEFPSSWDLDLSKITNNGTVEKRFDFVVPTLDCVFGIETNFYSSGGSKLNETSRSYKEMALESKDIPKFQFVWVTDGGGWNSARNNLMETFEVMDTIYNLNDLENGAFSELFNS